MLRVLDFVDGYHPAPDDDGSFMRQVEQIIRRSANGMKLFRYIYQRSTTVKLALVSESNDDKVFLISLCRSSNGMKIPFPGWCTAITVLHCLHFLDWIRTGRAAFLLFLTTVRMARTTISLYFTELQTTIIFSCLVK